jgi:hypothetical protein
MTGTVDILRDNLRRDTAKMLGIDLENMTAAQEVRLARGCMIRLELDDIETRKLNNQSFDLNKYIVASEALERLVGGNPDGGTNEFAGSREELRALIEMRLNNIRAREERLRSDAAAADEQPDPGGDVDASDAALPPAPPSAPPAARPEPDLPPAPPWARRRRQPSQRPKPIMRKCAG